MYIYYNYKSFVISNYSDQPIVSNNMCMCVCVYINGLFDILLKIFLFDLKKIKFFSFIQAV